MKILQSAGLSDAVIRPKIVSIGWPFLIFPNLCQDLRYRMSRLYFIMSRHTVKRGGILRVVSYCPMQFDAKLFSQKLRVLREEKKLTQADVAKAIGVDKSHVSKWEVGKSKPSIDSLLNLSELFGISNDYLLRSNVPREGVEAINDFELYEHFRQTDKLAKEKRDLIRNLVNAVLAAEKIKEIPAWDSALSPREKEKETTSPPLRKVAGKR